MGESRWPRPKNDLSERSIERAPEHRLAIADDVIWGTHAVMAALETKPEKIAEIILVRDRKGKKQREIIEMATRHRVRLSLCAAIRLTGAGAAEARHQGVAARIAAREFLAFENLLMMVTEQIAAGQPPLLVAGDNLNDPRNLGAIARSALAAGAMALILPKDHSAPVSGLAAKSAVGALEKLPVCQVTNLAQTLKALKKAGLWNFGAATGPESRCLYDADLRLPTCLVIGGEGEGIRPLVRRQCDWLLAIPMVEGVESLNSSVAAAVILFEARRQRDFARTAA
ncbi:MAG: 23S rRNA (guanosine(2251)-2'-O)-methyltransferase RlmB [Desulfobulbaceae bacterium]|jgi:23S rRNA (guanosine2251-2'-O)-methyltransferase|nr:23S rRNA (guanosine(2251)-2'-O)-methyltransferase RlmB [Desulfobulbaceae bacterium]